MVSAAHPTQPFDFDDLLDLPDDGLRYEVLDGALVVNAAPVPRHQRTVDRLVRLLQDAAPPGTVAISGVTWRIGPGQVPIPDVAVVDWARVGEVAIDGTPVLVAEVLSSNRGMDLVYKRALYAEAGCMHYWIVDTAQPSVLVLRLDGEHYVEVLHIVGDDRVEVTEPFAVSLSPPDLTAT